MEAFLIPIFIVGVLFLLFYEPIIYYYNKTQYPDEHVDEDPVSEKFAVVAESFTRPSDRLPRSGAVTVNGVIWRAETNDADRSFVEGDKCKVVDRDGLTLIVEWIGSSTYDNP